MGGGGSIRQGAFIREEHLNQFYQRRGGVYYIRGVFWKWASMRSFTVANLFL